MGLSLVTCLFSPDLKPGIILAALSFEGNTPNLKHVLKRMDNIGAITIAPAFTEKHQHYLHHNFRYSLTG